MDNRILKYIFSLYIVVLFLVVPVVGAGMFHGVSSQTSPPVPVSWNEHPYSNDHPKTAENHQVLFGYTERNFYNPYKDGNFNPGDGNNNRIEDSLEEEVAHHNPLQIVECFIILSTDDSLFDLSSLERAGAEVVIVLDEIDQIRIRVPVSRMEIIANLPGVAEICSIPRVAKCLNTSVSATGMSGVYSTGFTGQGTTIAVLDTGIDDDHEAFPGGKIRAFEDYTYPNWPYHQTTDPYDDDGHGTHCASIAAGDPPANGASGGKYKGVAYNADLLIVRVMGATVMGDVIGGVNWVIQKRNTYNVQVMSLSIGTVDQSGHPIHSDSMNSACNDAIGKGIVVCAAAGNDGTQYGMGSPANALNVITVGSCTDNGQLSSFSTRGPGMTTGAMKPDILAPGEYIIAARAAGTNMGWSNGVTDPTHYTGAQGTSMSCPHIAGVAAALREANSDTLVSDIRNAIRESGPNSNNPNNQRGCGKVDAKDALDLIGNSPKITAISVNGENAIGNIPEVLEDEIVQFTGTATDDKTLQESAFKWDFDSRVDSDGDGDKTNDADATGRSSFTSYSYDGLKTVILSVTDSDGFRVTEYCYVQVNNAPPTGEIITSGPVDEGVETSFIGTLSDSQSDIDTLFWYWDFDGDADVPFDGVHYWTGDGVTDNDKMAEGTGSSPSGTHTYVESGPTTVILKVEDNSGAEVAIEKIITVKNLDPTAVLALGADVDPEALYEDDPVIFDASGCTDTANDLGTLEYMWNFGDNEKSEWQKSPSITHSYAQQDTYTVSLKTRDNDGADDTDSINVYILNREPVAVINGLEEEYFEGDTITMIGTNSTDTASDAETLRHYWDLDAETDMEDDHDPATWWDDDGEPDNDREIAGGIEEFPYINNGTYPISLIVVDNDDAQDIALATIEIKNSLPRDLVLVALAEGVEHTETFEVKEGDIIDFRGSATDVEGDIDRLNYTWNFGDGDMAFGTEARHTFLYSQDVPFKVELSVMDDDHDDAAGKALEIYVKNIPPTLELGEDIHLDGNGTLVLTPKVGDSPADVASMRYRWCVRDHGAIPDFTDPDTTDEVLEFEFEIDGEYDVHLRIEDDNGESVRDSVKIVARKINPNGDYDNDRMPNGYEIKMGFDPRASDGDLDSDNDGFSNLQEYRANTDPTDGTDFPREAEPGLKDKLSDSLQKLDPMVWLIIAGSLFFLVSLIIIIRGARRRKEKKNLEKVFKAGTFRYKEGDGKKKGDKERSDKTFDYLSGEMGLRTKQKKGGKRPEKDIYAERPASRKETSSQGGMTFAAEDMSFFDHVAGEEDTYEEEGSVTEYIDTEAESGELYLPADGGEEEIKRLLPYVEDETEEASEEEFWPALEPDEEVANDRKKTFEDLFSMPISVEDTPGKKQSDRKQSGRKQSGGKKSGKHVMKPVADRKMPMMKPLDSKKKPTMKPLDRPSMKPRRTVSEKSPVGRKSGTVFHDDAAETKRIKAMPYKVEVILPEDQYDEVEEPGVDLTFKRPSSYKKRNAGVGKKGSAGYKEGDTGVGKKGSMSCKHCGSPVKSGWWLCPNCKKKL